MNREPEPPGAADPLDELDFLVLDEIRRLAEADDPVPAGLVPLIRFAVQMQDLDEEVSRMAATIADPAGVRGAEEETDSRTITFDSEVLTIMVRISGGQDPRGVRIDGWLAPAAAYRVDVRTPAGEVHTVADDQGRFSLDGIPHGLAQLAVRPLAEPRQDGPDRVVTTPAIVL